ncbi:MAG: response regulator [Lachnospiraceae bacterium]|nr:response regulator [Lachnospiraceae bacterium]
MATGKVILIGEKETFLVRVLNKKLQDAGISHTFITWDVNTVNQNWEGTNLVTLYMDEGALPPENVLHFLMDKMAEDNVQMIPIGERDEVNYICDHVPGELIYTTFIRPVDNDAFVKTVSEHLQKVQEGEFRKSILVVDDDPNYLSLVREWLKNSYKVYMVNSGLQAIKWLGKNKADLILLDHEMPVTSGPQVLEMLRSDEETRQIPVMFLTGKSDKESVMAVVALKPEGYFLKTISREELLEKLKEFFILH